MTGAHGPAALTVLIWSFAATFATFVAACNNQDGATGPSEQHRGENQEARRLSDSSDSPATKGALPLGTFSKDGKAPLDANGSRLPAAGDASAYIAATDLFPGTARLHPGIQNPYSGNKNAIAAGERHFAAFNCSGCHAPLGGGGMGPPLSDSSWIYGSEPAQIYLTILHGRPEGMPAFGSMLPRRTIWELIAYVETLQEIEDYAAEKGFSEKQPAAQGAGGEETGTNRTQAGQ